ncbi:hypothetical protein HNP84_009728 [Thermocatellispora tengchongensis]|uniref:Uncharacterized protein n=1 Tax=Thermocatellispora tengchongensis TaxID=1073253 RepID=A0A840PPH5_9ACTN|nr:hypothetical protein [Thermocatellispora tengchongensis]
MLMPLPRWQRALIVALLILPLLAIILLSLPVWLYLPFRESGRGFILELVREFTSWIKAAKSTS